MCFHGITDLEFDHSTARLQSLMLRSLRSILCSWQAQIPATATIPLLALSGIGVLSLSPVGGGAEVNLNAGG
jgi:hypothetical protein